MSAIKFKYPKPTEGSTVGSFFQYAKYRFIHMCYEFGKHRYSSIFYSGFLLSVSYFQIYSQILDPAFVPRISQEWGPFSFITVLMDICRLSPYMGGDLSYEITLLFVYITYAFVALFTASFYYMHISINIRKLHFIMPIEIAYIYSQLLYWILIIPICETYVVIYFCKNNGDAQLLEGVRCWSTEHIIHTAVITLGLVLHICAVYVIALCFNESRPYGEDAFARLDNNHEVLYATYRILTSLFNHWLISNGINWGILVIHFLYAIISAYNFYHYIPYYQKSISAVYCGFIAVHLWELINVFLFYVLGGDGNADDSRMYKGVAVVVFIGAVIVFSNTWNLRRQLIKQKIIQTHYDIIMNDKELDLYIQSLLNLYKLQQINPSDELLLRGILSRHKAECSDIDCPLRKPEGEKLYHPETDTESGEDKNNSRDKIVVLAMINSILRNREKDNKLGDQTETCFHLIYGNFLFKEMGNIHMTIVEVMRAQEGSPSMQQEISVYQLLRSIEEYLTKKYKKVPGEKSDKNDSASSTEYLDAAIVIKFENWLMQLLKITEKCAGDHIEFWGHLESMSPDLNELNRIGLTILTNTKEIIKIWKKITKINPNHPKALNTYGHYLRDIKNDEELGEEYIERAVAMNLHKSVADDPNNDFKLMFAEDTGIIVIDGSPEHLGKIIKTNAGVFKLFGYNPYEILGNDVSILMPGLLGNVHQKFMQKYFETGKQCMIQNERTLFALHRNNFIFCVSVFIKPISSLRNAIPQYIGMLRQVQKEFDFIMTDKNGKIDAISRGIYHLYNITSSFIKENQIYIHLICPELADPVLCDDQKLRLKFDVLRGRNKIRFFVPKGFMSLAHLFSQGSKETSDLSPIDCNQELDEASPIVELMKSSYFFRYTHKIYKGKYEGKKFNFERDNIVNECFDYSKAEVKNMVVCEIMNMTFGDNLLAIKVFKIHHNKIAKRRNSIDDYYTKDSPQQNTPQTTKKSHLDKRDTLKQSATSEEVKIEPFQKKPTGRDDSSSKVAKSSAPTFSDVVSIANFLSDNKDSKKTEDKKEETSKQMISKFSINFLDSSSNVDPRLITGSGASETVSISNFEDDRKTKLLKGIRREENPIIKTIDVGQTSVAKQLLLRKRSIIENKKEEQENNKDENQKENKEEGKDEEKEEGEEVKKQKSFKSEDSELRRAEQKKNEEEHKRMAGELCSVSTTNYNLVRLIHSLQTALTEIYTPPAITNLKLIACVILIALLGLTISGFIMGRLVYNKLDNNFDYILESMDRTTALANIAGFTRVLITLTCNDEAIPCLDDTVLDYNSQTNTGIQYLYKDQPVKYKNWVLSNIEEYILHLKTSQTILSNAEDKFLSKNAELINPSDIIVSVVHVSKSLSDKVVEDCPDAIDAIIVHALKNRADFIEFGQDWINNANDSVSFVLTNAFNNILIKFGDSLNALLDEGRNISKKNQNMLLYFLLGVNIVLILSISVVMPMVVRIRKNKQDLLCMFLDVPIKKARVQLDKCHLFCKMIHDESGVERQELGEDETEGKKMDDETELLLNKDSDKVPNERSKKHRKFKVYSSGIIILVIETVVVTSILESYFLYAVLRSVWLKNTVHYIVNEVVTISNRMTANELYYWIAFELISTNGTSYVMHEQVETYIGVYNDKILNDQEYFLQVHSSNSPYNSDRYKSIFDLMIYSDVCTIIFPASETENIEICHNYMDGVLKKGLNSANVAFWDSLKEIGNDFIRSLNRTVDLQSEMLVDTRLTRDHWLLYRYFTKAYGQLQDELRKSTQDLFDFEIKLLTVIFAIYLVLLFAIYVGFTKIFVENTKDSLWITKSLLTIIPPEVILQVAKIRQFVLSTSKSAIYGIKNE